MKTGSILFLAAVATNAFANFTAGNLVVATIGDAGADNLNQPVQLLQYTKSGSAVGSPLSLNNLGSRNITTDWGETSEGALELSANGQYLMIAGYDEAPLSALWNKFDSARAVARINPAGQVEFSSPFSLYDQNLQLGDGARAVASQTGSDFIVTGGDAGLYKGTFGNPTGTQVFNPALSTRMAKYFGGNFYFSGSNAYYASESGSGVNGLTTWSTNPADSFAKPGLFATPNTNGGTPGSGRDFEFVDANTMYYATSSGTVGLVKMVRTGGVWSEAYRLAGTGFNSIAVDTSGPQNVIYITGSAGADLFKITDMGTGFSATTSIATAPANTRFRGVSFAPTSGATISGSINLGSYVGSVSGSATVAVTFQLFDSSSNLVQTSTVNVAPSAGIASYSLPVTASVSGAVTLRAGAATWLVRPVSTTIGATNANFVLPNGDVVKDGIVDIADYSALAAAFDSNFGDANYLAGADLNKDGIVDIADYSTLAASFDLGDL
ncbi:MAG: hypothetical protein JNJ45_09830 [Chthonomonas sp.]|nr:hypothetical protein [Chthonomonas sp.]